MQPNRKELNTLARVQDLNHEALRMVGKIKGAQGTRRGYFSRSHPRELQADAFGDGENRSFT